MLLFNKQKKIEDSCFSIGAVVGVYAATVTVGVTPSVKSDRFLKTAVTAKLIFPCLYAKQTTKK